MNRVSVKQAAKELGVSIPFLRLLMKGKNINIGKAVKPSLKGKRTQYLIYRELLDRELGKEIKNELD